MATAAKNIVESLREVMQDLLVPELKAVRASVDSLRSETKTSIDALRSETKTSLDSLRSETKTSMDALRSEMVLRDDRLELAIRSGLDNTTEAIRQLAAKLDNTISIRERLASLEARMPQQ